MPQCAEISAVLSVTEGANDEAVLQWDPEDGPPASGARGLGEEVVYDNAVLYDNLPSPKIFARYPPADRRASRPSPDKLSCNHYKYPPSCSLPPTNPASLGRASLGLGAQVQHLLPSCSRIV